MESAAGYLEGIDIEGYSCIISLNDDGSNTLQILKDKKLLKGVPAKLKKHPQYLEIAEVSKAWKAQHQRARFLMEDMMQRRTPLAVDDVRAILSNPVVSPMFKKLVLLQDHHLGLPTAEGLDTLSGLKNMVSHRFTSRIRWTSMRRDCGLNGNLTSLPRSWCSLSSKCSVNSTCPLPKKPN